MKFTLKEVLLHKYWVNSQPGVNLLRVGPIVLGMFENLRIKNSKTQSLVCQVLVVATCVGGRKVGLP